MKIEKLTKIKTDYYETSPDNFQLMEKINEIIDTVNNITEQPKEEVDGFDAELNALLKKYEYLPKEELVECLEFYLGVVNKSEAEMVGMEGLGKIWDEKKDPILQRLDKIFDVLTEIKINTVLRQPYITSDPPQPIQPWYGTETVTCGEQTSTETTNTIENERPETTM